MYCYHIIIFPRVCLCALTLYPSTDCAAATDISSVTSCWQLSRYHCITFVGPVQTEEEV